MKKPIAGPSRTPFDEYGPVPAQWFRPGPEGAFFGNFYWEGDHSFDGFLPDRPLRVANRTRREVDGVIRLLDLDLDLGSGIRLLDAPCGYGRHVEAFAQRGIEVSGLDITPTFAETAQRTLEQAALTGDIRLGELTQLPFPDATFDVVTNMFFSFGFYRDDADNLRCLREFRRVLKPGGQFLMHTDVNVPLIILGQYRQPTFRRLESGAHLIINERMNWDTSRLEGTWTIRYAEGEYQYQDEKTMAYSMRVYTPDEFSALCERAGLRVEKVAGGFDAEDPEYRDTSEEMIVIARRR